VLRRIARIQQVSLRRAATQTAGSVRQALGLQDTSVRVALPDAAGRLRVVADDGPAGSAGRLRSSRRREVFETGRGVVVEIAGEGGEHVLSILPLTTEDETVGVIELVAPRRVVLERRETIAALVRQSAALMKVSRERVEQERSSHGMERLLGLATALDQVRGAVEAMALVARACSEHLDVPVVVTRPDRDGNGWFLAAAAGMGSTARTQLRRMLREMPAAVVGDGARPIASVFRATTNLPAVVLPAVDAKVLVGSSDDPSGFARVASLMLAQTLEHLTGRGRGGDVRMGIAWTAHELRGPLAGAKAALEHVISGNDDAEGIDLLRRTKIELERLTDLVDPLLEWSAGQGQLHRVPADLVQIVRDAVISSAESGQPDRARIEGPARLAIDADVVQLRVAIANLVRNALAYAPRSSEVRVLVEDMGSRARVLVQDDGPGVRADELDALFDPFVRGADVRNVRRGKGLGLFIASRVTEAHGGSIRVEPSETGARFCLELPLNVDLSPASAS
jgi:signal transduction histidine kinase